MKNTLLLILLVSLVYSQEKPDALGYEGQTTIYSDKFDRFIKSNAGKIFSIQYYPIKHGLKVGLGFKDAFEIQVMNVTSGDEKNIFVHFYYVSEYSSYAAFIDYKDFTDVRRAMNRLIKEYNKDKNTTDVMRQKNYKVGSYFVSSDDKFRVGYSNRSPINKYDLQWTLYIDGYEVDIDLVKLGTLFNTIAFKIDDLTDGDNDLWDY